MRNGTRPTQIDSGLTERRTVPQDAETLVRLAGMTLGCEWTREFVEWKYFENPAGPIFGYCAQIQGRPVAFYGNTPVRLKLGERVVVAAQAVDAMVVEEMRRRGLFVSLAQRTYNWMDRGGVALTYAFPNPQSQAGFLGRLAWTSIGAIPRYVKALQGTASATNSGRTSLADWLQVLLLHAARLTSARRVPRIGDPGIRIDEVESFDDRFDRIWGQAAGQYPIAVVRDAVYLNWRYARQPHGQYVALVAERRGQLAGYAVLSKRDVVRRGVIALVEFLVVPGDEAAGLALLAESTAYARVLGARQLQAWMLPHWPFYCHVLNESGLVYWPTRLAPRSVRYTVPFIIRVAAQTARSPDPVMLEHWYLSMGDHDYW